VSHLWELDGSVSRSISAENPTGGKSSGAMATEGTGARAARELGRGWKVSPSIDLPAGATATLADIEGSGVIQHFWLATDPTDLRGVLLRMYWDDLADTAPSVAVPLGDFFCTGWPGSLALVDSTMVVVAPAGGLNSFWPMPFHRRARITLENTLDYGVPVYYQISYALRALPEHAAHLHAQWRRSNPVGEPAVHTLVAGVSGRGRYVGTYMALEPGHPGWWGEGEFKFYLDGDGEFPTICGTGTEDYFGGAWNFDSGGRYLPYSTAYLGLPRILPPDRIYEPRQRFGMYRWHARDPICFERDLRVTVQMLGWQSGGRYRQLREADVATTAFWYLDRPRPVTSPDPGDLAVEPLGQSGSRWTELRSRLRPPWRRRRG
jgi:hypothetical protein